MLAPGAVHPHMGHDDVLGDVLGDVPADGAMLAPGAVHPHKTLTARHAGAG